MTRRLAALGVALIAVGALALAAPTLGFGTITADRGVGVDTSDRPLLTIDATEETPSQNEDAVVLEMENNAGQTFDPVATDVTIDDPNGALAVSDGFADRLEAGEVSGLELTCKGGGDGEATIHVEASGSGPTITVDDVTVSHEFRYSCTGHGGTDPGDASFSASDIDADDPVQTFEFDGDALGNKDEAVIDLSGVIDADYSELTDDDVEVVRGDARSVTFDPEAATITYQARGSQAGTIELRISGFSVEGDTGGVVSYSDDADRTDADTVAIE